MPINMYDPKSTGAESYMSISRRSDRKRRIKNKEVPMAVKRKGLGKGLDSLIPEKSNEAISKRAG